MDAIQMVDLKGQYSKIKNEIDNAVLACIDSAEFINGPAVRHFEENLATYVGANHAIGCANGTDALQIAFMALGLQAGDEVIVPAFTYVATAEAAALLGIIPVMVDVCPDTFNLTGEVIEKAITSRTRAVVPVHLFGQSCDMSPIIELARSKGILVIEDNAQSIGAKYLDRDGAVIKTGTLGDVACTSFFPSKNLGCFGDGGALTTNNDELAAKLRMTANHGQAKKYHHSVVGVNSRLDTIQAAILDVKLKYLDAYCTARRAAADRYDEAFAEFARLKTPIRAGHSTHVFHQYTLIVQDGRRDSLQKHLAADGISSAIYYPRPLYKHDAFERFSEPDISLPVTEFLCNSVLSLPIHSEMDEATQSRIIRSVARFYE